MKISKKLFVMGLLVGISVSTGSVISQGAKKNYKVSPKTKPVITEYRDAKEYNKHTKHYFMLRSYLEKMEENGGGTLTLKKGTYKIPATLYVPSNVTIKCKNGVKLVKTKETGTKKLKATKYMFQMVASKKVTGKKKVSSYKGTKKVQIKGRGKVSINLGEIKGAIGIYMAHNSGITIDNIQFKKKNGGNYIWAEGSKNVKITNCKFYEGKTMAGTKNKLAVRLENINETINEFNGKWSKLGNTVNNNIKITNNKFYNAEIAIGSVKYVSVNGKDYYQKKIQIKGNSFYNTKDAAIQGVGWKKPEIANNLIKTKKTNEKTVCGICGYGLYNPSITGNVFNNCEYTIVLRDATNSGKGKEFPKMVAVMESGYVSKLEKNAVVNVSHFYVLQEGRRIFYFRNKTDRNFVITTNSTPYHEYYNDAENYAQKKMYYVFLSYMEQLEYAGGGTITIEPGTYSITNQICVPSNVTINLKDGVVLQKVGTTATDVCYAKSIFTLVPPSKDGTVNSISGYNGSKNVKIIGSGTATIDCKNVKNAMGVVMGHGSDITLSGLTFLNEYGSHFVELNSSQNVVIENCTFKGFKVLDEKSHKECINIDGTDLVTQGFNYDWSTHDLTACKNIVIRNNTFQNVGTAIGSHTFMAKNGVQIYHENIQITGNTVDGTYNSGIRALNWKNTTITGNMFKNHQSLDDGKGTRYVAMLLRGVVNATVKGNTFDTGNYYAIRVTQVTAPTTDAAKNAGYPDTVCALTEQNWTDMKQNTIINYAEKYQNIVWRQTQNQSDKEATKIAFESVVTIDK